MKSSIIASALFASLALAAPLNKRVYATKTHTVIETVVVYTTVWDNQQPATSAPAATSSPALFFEKPSAAPAVPSSSAAPAPAPVPEAPSSSSTPEPVVPSPTPAPAPVSSEAPSSSAAPIVEPTPSPSPSPEPTPSPSPSPSPTPEVTPEAAPSSAAPVAEASPASSSSGGSGSGETYTGSLTMNYYGGGTGACGAPVDDGSMEAALSVEGFGETTFDRMTGEATNFWCNKKIRITYNGKTADATVVDRCSGCTGKGGLDATPALWQALTGGLGGASGDRLESGMSFTIIG